MHDGAVGLNIKNERVCALAKQAAAEFDMSQTSVIEKALEEYLARHSAEQEKAARLARARRTLDEIHGMLTDEDVAEMKAFQEDMYDEMGLPK